MFKFDLECYGCFLSQGLKHGRNMKLDLEKRTELVHHILGELEANKNNPPTPVHIGARIIYRKLADLLQDEDPFKQIKEMSNVEALKLLPRLKEILHDPKNLHSSEKYDENGFLIKPSKEEEQEGEEEVDESSIREQRLLLGLKLAAAGNTIDFGGSHTPSIESLKEEIETIPNFTFAIRRKFDRFKSQLSTCKNLMYIGDNCGEIVFDKVFIEFLLSSYQNIETIYYVCRGRPIINDITMEDAVFVGLDKLSEKIKILPSTDPNRKDKMAFPGTVLKETTPEFMEIWNHKADVILSKGQGNFETLLGYEEKENLYLLLKAKCIAISGCLDVELLSLVFTTPFKKSNKNVIDW